MRERIKDHLRKLPRGRFFTPHVAKAEVLEPRRLLSVGDASGGMFDPPYAPGDVTAEARPDGNLLTWTDQSTNEFDFVIRRTESHMGVGAWAFETIGTVRGNGLGESGGRMSYLDVPPANTVYVYEVSSRNAVGTGTPYQFTWVRTTMWSAFGLRATFNNYGPSRTPAVVSDAPAGLIADYLPAPPDPRVETKNFNGIFEGTLTPDQGASYRIFTTTSNNLPISVRITDPRNGRVLLDFENSSGSREIWEIGGRNVDLQAGVPYLVRVNVMSDEGAAPFFRVRWEANFIPRQVIPHRLLAQPPGAPGPKVSAVFLHGRGFTTPFAGLLGGSYRGSATLGYALGEYAPDASLPWFGLDEISVRFDRAVEVAQDDLVLRGADATPYGFAGFEYDASTLTAKWTLDRSIDSDRVTLELNGDPGGVSAPGGAALDGEWVRATPNGVATGRSFPTGDGSAGGDFRLAFGALPGDANSDGAVNAVDLAEVKRRLNTRTTDYFSPHPVPYSPFADVTADGRINAADLASVKQRLNRRLPPPPTPPVAPAGAVAFAVSANEPLAARLRPITRGLFADLQVLA